MEFTMELLACSFSLENKETYNYSYDVKLIVHKLFKMQNFLP
jgi:hypothetical protein